MNYKLAFSSQHFKENSGKFMEIIQHVLENPRSKVVMPVENHHELPKWLMDFDSPLTENKIEDLLQEIVSRSINIHHPCYIGHQGAVPLPLGVLSDMLMSFLNNSVTLKEMAPLGVLMERELIKLLAGYIGYDKEAAGGIFTSGGSIGNLTALLTARQMKAGYDLWKEGYDKSQPIGFMGSEHAHYCLKRSLQIMGLGESSFIPLKTNSCYQIDVNLLEEAYQNAIKKGIKPIAIVGSACNTAPGTFDDLSALADFAEKHDLWFHVDGAHGATMLLSEHYKKLVKGIERADSVVWDMHKMMLLSSMLTAVFYKNKEHSTKGLEQFAPYLGLATNFSQMIEEYPYHQTLECTRSMNMLKLFISLRVYGMEIFKEHVEYLMNLTVHAVKILQDRNDFELALLPQSNIVCFRYVGKGGVSEEYLNECQKKVRMQLIENGNYYIVQTVLNGKHYLRMTISNPRTEPQDFEKLFNEIKELAGFE